MKLFCKQELIKILGSTFNDVELVDVCFCKETGQIFSNIVGYQNKGELIDLRGYSDVRSYLKSLGCTEYAYAKSSHVIYDNDNDLDFIVNEYTENKNSNYKINYILGLQYENFISGKGFTEYSSSLVKAIEEKLEDALYA